MPKNLKDKLYATAAKRGYSKSRTKRYVYGTLKKLKTHGRL